MLNQTNAKKILLLLVVMVMLFTFLLPSSALASDIASTSGANITIVVPNSEQTQPTPVPTPPIPRVFPVHVWENRENNRREIVRVYELRDDENPAYIPRESFERDGFLFELAEIVRRDVPSHSVKEHIEVVLLNTQTNDLATVIRLLSPTLEYMTADGYLGVLTLDVTTIKIESRGTRTTNHTVTRTREFPHLSSPDTSLIPRTITENGRTYNLSAIEWQTQTTTAVDYTQVGTSFTAVATYTGTATNTSVIGYTTTAEYRGQVSRVTTGRTEYTASFIGVPIITPVISAMQIEFDENEVVSEIENDEPDVYVYINISDFVEDEIVYDIYEQQYGERVADANNNSGTRIIRNILLALLIIASIVIAYFVGKKGKAVIGIAKGMMKKSSCVIIAVGLIVGMTHPVSAAPIPRYGFGNRGGSDAVHFDTRRIDNNTVIQPFTNTVSYTYGDVIGTLSVERLGKTVNVIGGATTEAMDMGAGHFSFTGLNNGNTGLIGHNRGVRNGYFDFVRLLREGDIIILDAGGVMRKYAVSQLYVINDTDFTPLMQFGDNRLTLITCVEYQPNQRRVAVAVAIE